MFETDQEVRPTARVLIKTGQHKAWPTVRVTAAEHADAIDKHQGQQTSRNSEGIKIGRAKA